ncbi:uncharacterized protein Z520_01387 [Fonsecaea multimorphosa CBS 102226]|uniref:Aconitase/3-isopropylmalate dehydratase large subunit alpha/beta/alpha domain-containing protein n=1 Tax=Fonsecaea multimorphosa CBS 102226 TaxID=1442371 RepID=A0A0D2J0R3_9EURO|nr:uncharacterized protein Z520_01387 [Fonsecaea multimorphosa CBS 102226]KIY02922.1 hypothetical protein Z520_01387 [Fonsecaea multimorphosa CBS 102226]OAL30756.1 hypothetical protein AYO22_01376 [Fonsecaea multimorphosa]
MAKNNSNNSMESLLDQTLEILRRTRKIELPLTSVATTEHSTAFGDYFAALEEVKRVLVDMDKHHEAEAIGRAAEYAAESTMQGGLGIQTTQDLDPKSQEKVLASVEAWLESLNAVETARRLPKPLAAKSTGTRPMNLTEKILAHHSIDPLPLQGVKEGDFVRLSVDWIIASESSWFGMSKTLRHLPGFKPWRNDRLWLAADHVVDPRTYETPLNRRLLDATDNAARDFKLTDYKGPNYTIIHTEFVRQRAEPGLFVLGADSHTCSSGAVGCLAIGLGAVDVAIALATGESWIKVPACINIRFVGRPGLGIGGKDVILYILGELKRNTVAANRIVEFSGPGTQYLSVDARFAISNMCTEFGAITGVFVPDALVKNYIDSRKQKYRRSSPLYFRPDADCQYAESFEIDLSKVQSYMAIYPSPDDVVPISQQVGRALDGCFIGACTTTEEDLILGALVLQVGLRKGLKKKRGKKHVVPGSLPITERLDKLGLLDFYREAGFVVGVPGCSFCVGMGADQAQEGEVWLSSQNRNFKNRMGKGSIGNLASAAAVAASSFSMTVTDPAEFLEEVDMRRYDDLRKPGKRSLKSSQSVPMPTTPLAYVEPNFVSKPPNRVDDAHSVLPEGPAKVTAGDAIPGSNDGQQPQFHHSICSKVIRLGDFIDTDAIAPAESLVTAITDEDLGQHCMKYVMPEFRDKVRNGQRVIVGGQAFGVGSSREAAVRAFNGLGVECVIARSFAFIYGRNQPNLGLLGITITDDHFYDLAKDDVDIQIRLEDRTIMVAGSAFGFSLTDMELSLTRNQGMLQAYRKFGNRLFQALGNEGHEVAERPTTEVPELSAAVEELQW